MMALTARGSVITEATRILEHAVFTTYSHETRIDEIEGRFELDCSAFANYVLSRAEPAAGQALASGAVHPERPLARDFFSWFRDISSQDSRWLHLSDVRELQPGDFIAWLIPPESNSRDTGHVMIVKQSPYANPENSGEWLTSVIDAAASGHGKNDRRRKAGPNGVGSGVVGLVADDRGRPLAFRWSGGESVKTKYTAIQLARVRH
jgi:hypothetical protein